MTSRPSFALPGAPPPLPPRTKQILDAVNEINELLAQAYQSPSVTAYVNKVTVQAALEMWQGKEPEIPVSAEEINSCDGVKAIFPIVKRLEAICDSIPMKVPVDHIQFCLWKLSDEYQISMFGAEFCRANHLLRGRLSTPSERSHCTETRTPSFILSESEVLSTKFASPRKSNILPPPSSPPPVIDSGGPPLPPPMSPPPSSLPPPSSRTPRTSGSISETNISQALHSSSDKVVHFDLAKNNTTTAEETGKEVVTSRTYTTATMEWTDATTGDVCALVETPIAIETSINFVRSPCAGAVSTFLGTTRDVFEGKRVTSLTYESYVEMAIESLKELCCKIRKQWSVTKIALIHKLGDCPIGEISVLIAISSEHRKESLEAVHFAIDELKKTVPIWKKVCM